jgi:UDP-glucose 4-epimerase
MWVLTGGAGYIGSHVSQAMVDAGFEVLILDNLSNGLESRVPKSAEFIKGDIRDESVVKKVLGRKNVVGVINLAGLKSVEESQLQPNLYLSVNFKGVSTILNAAKKFGVRNFLQSSSAAVYGRSDSEFVSEKSICNPISVYGESKLLAENEINQFSLDGHGNVTSLRYFNVLGATSPILRDSSKANVLPKVLTEILAGRPPIVFGNDYPTRDGTCVRDYVHVADIARAHVLAASKMLREILPQAINLGTGRGYSVYEVIREVQRVKGTSYVPIVHSRRNGDAPMLIAKTGLAKDALDFVAEFDLKQMVESAIG